MWVDRLRFAILGDVAITGRRYPPRFKHLYGEGEATTTDVAVTSSFPVYVRLPDTQGDLEALDAVPGIMG